MLESPEANLMQLLFTKFGADLPEYRFVEQDLKQLENYEIRPAVSWPCCLIDIEEMRYSDSVGNNHQIAEGFITFRSATVKYTDINNLTPVLKREAALGYLEIENKLFKKLHGWNPTGFGKLLRRSSITELREDDIRVKVIKFAFSYTDTSAERVVTRVPRPGANLGIEK
jgi:hypothetical protein